MVEGWVKKSIGEMAEILSGGTPRTNNIDYWDGNISWCTPSDITNCRGVYINSTERLITEEGLDNSSAVMLPAGTILLCTRATIGEMSIAAKPMCTNQGFKNLIVRKGINNVFLYYALNLVKREMISKSYGSTFLELSKKALESIEITVPSKEEEQEKIATALSSIDELIDSLQKEIAKKKNIKYGVLQSYVTGKRRIDGFSSKWKEKTIDELCTLVTKQTGFDYSAEIKPSLVQVHYSNTLPFLQNKDFEGYSINYDTDFYIPTEVAYKYPKIFLDDICLLISISGRIGNVAMFNHERDAFVGGAVGVAKFKNPELVEWTMLYLMGTDGQKQIFENEKAGAQHNLTVEDVRHLTIPIPSDEERKAITAMMSDIEEDIIHLEHKLEKYKMLKQGMISDLLTGKIRSV